MTEKEKVIKIISGLPDNVNIDDIFEELYFRQKVEKGLFDIDRGRLITHEETKERLTKWLTR